MPADVVIPKNELSEFDLPRICVITGQTEGISFKPVKFAWYPRWLLIFLPFAALIVLLIAIILTKRAKGTLPFSEEGWARWQRSRLLFGLSFLGTIAILVGGIVVFAGKGNGTPILVAVLVAVLVPVVAYFTAVKGRVPLVKKIDERTITLRLPSDSAATTIAAHLNSGRRPRSAQHPLELRSA